MTTQEFSNEFDVLYNNIMSNQAPGLDEYEKSVFLTKAQYEIIKNYFNEKGNKYQEGFDDSEKRQADFSRLITSCIVPPYSLDEALKFDSRSLVYKFPEDMFIILNEQVVSEKNRYSVLPLKYSEYTRLMTKPFKYPLKSQVWRIITNSGILNSNIGTESFSVQGIPYSLRIANKCEKRVTFTIVASHEYPFVVDGSLNPEIIPSISETENAVSIHCKIPTSVASELYWKTFLYNSSSLENSVNLEPYIGTFNAAEGESSFPAIPKTPEDADPEELPNYDYTVSVTTYPKKHITIAELIGLFNPTETLNYVIRYLRNPRPIILQNLDNIQNGLQIEGLSQVTECELPSEIHNEILQRAVELAKAAYAGDLNSSIQLGNRSE